MDRNIALPRGEGGSSSYITCYHNLKIKELASDIHCVSEKRGVELLAILY